MFENIITFSAHSSLVSSVVKKNGTKLICSVYALLSKRPTSPQSKQIEKCQSSNEKEESERRRESDKMKRKKCEEKKELG